MCSHESVLVPFKLQANKDDNKDFFHEEVTTQQTQVNMTNGLWVPLSYDSQ